MTTASYEAQTADINVFTSTAQAEGIDAGSSSTAAPAPKLMPRTTYEGFLELPVWFVVAVMWVAVAALLGSCALVVYMVGSVLLRAVVGSL
jgi:type VI protein secretion system component VasF